MIPSSHGLGVKVLWRYFHIGWLNESVNKYRRSLYNSPGNTESGNILLRAGNKEGQKVQNILIKYLFSGCWARELTDYIDLPISLVVSRTKPPSQRRLASYTIQNTSRELSRTVGNLRTNLTIYNIEIFSEHQQAAIARSSRKQKTCKNKSEIHQSSPGLWSLGGLGPLIILWQW